MAKSEKRRCINWCRCYNIRFNVKSIEPEWDIHLYERLDRPVLKVQMNETMRVQDTLRYVN